MAMTIRQLRILLDPDEPNYPHIKSLVEHDDIPNLEQLASANDVLLASKAVYAISLIGTPAGVAALERLATSPRVEVRIAVSGGVRNLGSLAGAPFVTRLLNDPDVSVRKGAIRASGRLRLTGVTSMLQRIAASDQVTELRRMATETLDAIR